MTAPQATSAEVAKPIVARFRGHSGPVMHLPVPLPTDTMDPRWAACTDHRVACDCREAEMAENLREYRYERDQAALVFNEVLKGHQTFAYTADGVRDRFAECKCTGCEIARRTYFRTDSNVGEERREAQRARQAWLSSIGVRDEQGEVPF